MRIYIDTNTFSAVPSLYADAEKTKPLPRVLPVVEGWAQELKICFLGARLPSENDAVFMVFSPSGSASEVARSTNGVRSIDACGNPEYTIALALDTSAMRVLLGGGKQLNLLAGVLVTNAGAGTRIEYQFRVTVSESVLGVWESPVSFAELNLALASAREAERVAKVSAEEAQTFAKGLEDAVDTAERARDAAEESKKSASGFADDAADSAKSSGEYAEAAEESKKSAGMSAENAAESEKNAKDAETRTGNLVKEVQEAKRQIDENTANFAKVDVPNTFTVPNLFSAGLAALPFGTKTALGADAYGFLVSAMGGLQLFGTHFLLGDLWTEDSVKMVRGNVSLYSTNEAAIGFDYANKVIFRTMPNDGLEASYVLEAWEWTDDSHTVKAATAGVKLLKPAQKSALEAMSVLNMSESDNRYGQLTASNAWTGTNAFDGGTVTAKTQVEMDNSSKVATTAFVHAVVGAGDFAKNKDVSGLKKEVEDLGARVDVLENTAVGKVAYGRLFSSDIDSAGKLVKIKVLLSDTGTPITTYTAGYFSTTDGGDTLTWVDETGIKGTVWQIIDTFDSTATEVDVDYVSGDGWTSSTRDSTTTYLREYDPAGPGVFTPTASRQGISYYVEKVVKVTTTDDAGAETSTYTLYKGTRTIDIDETLGAENTWFKEIAPFSTARTKHIPVTIGGIEYDNVMTEMDPVMMNRIQNFSLSVPVRDATTGETLSSTEITGELWVYTCDEDMTFKATIDGVADTPCTFFRAPTFVDYDGKGKLSKGYFGRYEASKVTASTGTILVSQSTHQNPAHTSTRYDFLTMARRSNAGTSSEFTLNSRSWSIEPLEDLHLIGFLLVIMSGNRNTQTTFVGRTGQAAGVDLFASCGDCDPLLDGNLLRVLSDYGYPEGVLVPGSFRARTSNLSSFFFFEENPYGSKWKHRPDLDVRSITDGTVISDTLTAEGDFAYLFHCHDRAAYDCYFHPSSALTRDGITYPANPHSARFAEENGYVNTGAKWPLGFPSGYYGVSPVRSGATPWMLIPGHPRPSVSSGAATHGVGDCFWTTVVANVTSATSAYSMNYVISGGIYSSGSAAGAFALTCYSAWPDGTVTHGVRPSFSLQGQGSEATAQ